MDINTHFSSQLDWIKQHLDPKEIKPLTGDAGFRSYFRVINKDNKNFIFVDASRDPSSFNAYVLQSQHLASYRLPIPDMIAIDKDQHYALLSDFGDDLLFTKLNINTAIASYKLALNILNKFHQCDIQAYGAYKKLDYELMLNELLGFQEWYLEKYLNKKLLAETKNNLLAQFQLITNKITQQPYVFIHRDYHSKNIFLIDNSKKLSKSNNDNGESIGLIDFQDAMSGPVTYDLVSLLRDCYIENLLNKKEIEQLALFYKKQNDNLNNITDQQFIVHFDYTGLQRHLKAICTFARKYVRDNDENYLKFIPNTLNYIFTVSSQYPELKFLNSYIKEIATRPLISCHQN